MRDREGHVLEITSRSLELFTPRKIIAKLCFLVRWLWSGMGKIRLPAPVPGEGKPSLSLDVGEDEQPSAISPTSVPDLSGGESKEIGIPRPPPEIGSRRLGQKPEKPISAGSRRLLLELICRESRASGAWEVVLSANDGPPLAEVRLEDRKLDITNPEEIHIPSLRGCLIVLYQNGQKHRIPLFEGKVPLIFKLRKDWKGNGHKISRITNGHFIVIAPKEWERTGHVPVESDNCEDANFQAHYWHTTTPSEGSDGFKECGIPHSGSVIELSGQTVFDDSEEGDLFVGDILDLQVPKSIVWARVGEEVKDGWKGENFEPHKKPLSEILGNREGRFFLRVYNSQSELVDGIDFRYLRTLKRIYVDGEPYTRDKVFVPSVTGYSPIEVRFVDVDGAMISPHLENESACMSLLPSGILEVLPHPDADHISCSFGPYANGVKIVLNLPRIWWRIESACSIPGKWCDTPLTMTRNEFQEHARANAKISILSRRIQPVYAGFGDERRQKYTQKVKENSFVIPLDDFIDYRQIDERLLDDVCFNMEWGGKVLPIIRVSADPVPEIVSFTAKPTKISSGQEAILQWASRNAEEARITIQPGVGEVESEGSCSVHPTQTTKYTLALNISGIHHVSKDVIIRFVPRDEFDLRSLARVQCSRRGWRNGKGFSISEIQGAGFMVQEAKDRSIRVDGRRRSSHSENIEEIRRIFDV